MFKKIFAMIFGGKAATEVVTPPSATPTTPATVVSESQGKEAPQFQTAEFEEKFQLDNAELERKIKSLTEELEKHEEHLPSATAAAEELRKRRHLERMARVNRQRGDLMSQLRGLRSALLEEERQDLLNKHLILLTLFKGGWQRGVSYGSNGQPLSEWWQERRVCQNAGEIYLILVIQGSPERVAWATTAVAQMTQEELEAVVRFQQEKEG